MVELALIAWFPITVGLFLVLKPHVAAAASMIFGVALLPSLRAIPVPLIPDLSQYTVPVLASSLMVAAMHAPRLVAARPGLGGELLVLLMIPAALVTNLTNSDPQVFASTVLPGMEIADTVNDALRVTILWGLPFLLGRALVRTPKQAVEVLTVLGIAGLVYVPFILWELRAGPYWHALVYGSQPSITTFMQSLKFGGYRPVVLMNHGLTLSAFMLFTTIAWAGLHRTRSTPFKLPGRPVVLGLAAVVLACKSVAVYLYAACVLPVLLFLRPRVQILLASAVAVVIIAYPFLRSVDLLPIKQVAEIAGEYGGYQTAASFLQRIETEDQVLGRTAERYLFGWGGYSRYYVYDPLTGNPVSVMDGYWLVQFGSGGLARFLLLFAFLVYPVFYAARRIDSVEGRTARYALCAMVWIVTLRTFDLLPNSTIDPYLTFLGGASCGVAQEAASRRRRPGKRRRAARSARASAAEPDSEPEPEPRPEPDAGGAGSLAALASQGGSPRRSATPGDASHERSDTPRGSAPRRSDG